jgi:superfamily II DNA/RNA helicase
MNCANSESKRWAVRSSQRVLIATDCLSEGINLQEHFTGVLHYDLPWNPNRLEQREGRVDRFGQVAPDRQGLPALWG